MKIFETFLTGVTTGSIYSLMAIALVLVWRSTRVLNFAQAGQAILSTYIGYEIILRTNSFFIGLIASMIFGALIGGLIDLIFMRTLFKRIKTGPIRLIAPVVTTLGLLGILQSTIILFWGLENRSINSPFSTKGFMVGETILPFSPSDLAIFIVVLIAILILVLIFQKTSIGLQLRASAFAPEISRLSGIKVDFVRTVGWSLAGAIGGLAGVLATSITVVNPYSLDILLVFGFVAAVIGGLDSLFGAVAGSLVLGIAINFSVAFINSQMIFPITFFVLILCLLIRPEGLFSSTKVRKDS